MSEGRIDRLGDLIRRNLREVPDFPQVGVLFRDISPLFANAEDFPTFIDVLSEHYEGRIDAVAGLESRGFPLAAPLAVALKVPMIMIRKSGKLPGPVLHQDYALEYGTASMELQPFIVEKDARVLVVDDVLATGGTARASVSLVEAAGGRVAEIFVLMELEALGGRARLGETPVRSLLTV